MLKVYDYRQFKSKAQTCLEKYDLKILMPFTSYHHHTKKKNNRACEVAIHFRGECTVFQV